MPFISKTWLQYVTDFLAQFASQTGTQPVQTPGDPLLAIAEAAAGQDLFLQTQAQNTTNFARVTTSSGPDVDSWLLQFGFTRLPALQAQGQVQLTIPTPSTVSIVIPAYNAATAAPGATVQTLGGAIQYQLIPDTTQSAYSSQNNAYILPAGSTQIFATAQALVAGAGSNVQANSLVQFGSSSYGVTSVTNLTSILNGSNAESDNAVRTRFVQYINSLSKGTYNAIISAAESINPNFTFNILNDINASGATQAGFFTVVVNNPGQTVGSSAIASIQTAINNIRAFTTNFAVVAATPVLATITIAIELSNSNLATATETAVQTAIVNYVNSLIVGQKLYLTNLVTVAENASTNILSAQFSSITINGVQLDLTATQFQVIQATTASVSVTSYSG